MNMIGLDLVGADGWWNEHKEAVVIPAIVATSFGMALLMWKLFADYYREGY